MDESFASRLFFNTATLETDADNKDKKDLVEV